MIENYKHERQNMLNEIDKLKKEIGRIQNTSKIFEKDQ